MPRQTVTLTLHGITAGDYLAHVRDPEPPALGAGLRSLSVRAEPLGDVVEAVLEWEDCVPAPRVAARAAGLPLVAEVVAVESHPESPDINQEDPMIARKLTNLADRAAAALLRSRSTVSPVPQPLLLRWA